MSFRPWCMDQRCPSIIAFFREQKKGIYWNWSCRFHSAFCEEQTQKIYRKWLQVPLRFANKQTESRSTGIDCTSFIVFREETKIKHDLKGIDCRYHHLLRTTNTKHSLELIAGSISFWEEANTKHLLELILQVTSSFEKNKLQSISWNWSCRFHDVLGRTNRKHLLELMLQVPSHFGRTSTKHRYWIWLQIWTPLRFAKNKHKASCRHLLELTAPSLNCTSLRVRHW